MDGYDSLSEAVGYSPLDIEEVDPWFTQVSCLIMRLPRDFCLVVSWVVLAVILFCTTGRLPNWSNKK